MRSIKKILIIGATSYIAKGLIYFFSKHKEYELFLFARSSSRVLEFANSIGITSPNVTSDLDSLSRIKCDVLINCVGIGDPGKLMSAIGKFFTVTERFDTFAIDYLLSNLNTLYINFSSGAAYCADFNVPVDSVTTSKIQVNSIQPEHYYGITKLYGEMKHRALKELNIVDLRIFGYFSRFIDLNSRYLITEILNAIKNKRVFVTTADDIIRDYLSPEDLFCFIQQCMARGNLNDAFDLYSSSPVHKFELLEYFKKDYSLQYSILKRRLPPSATGSKNCYYSKSKKAASLGYDPKYSSLESIGKEVKHILNSN